MKSNPTSTLRTGAPAIPQASPTAEKIGFSDSQCQGESKYRTEATNWKMAGECLGSRKLEGFDGGKDHPPRNGA